jgi:hypothetical protein
VSVGVTAPTRFEDNEEFDQFASVRQPRKPAVLDNTRFGAYYLN